MSLIYGFIVFWSAMSPTITPSHHQTASLSALAMLLIATYNSPSSRKDPVFVYAMLAIVGIGISITFGSFAQIVSMFPQQLHPFFFMGTYAPFFIFAPVNIAVKDLCEPIQKVRAAKEDSRLCLCSPYVRFLPLRITRQRFG